LMDELALDEDEIKSDSSLVKDLGAESIDFLAIVFKLEQAFGFKIAQGELFPENVMSDPRFVRDGKVTAEGLTALKARLPHVNFAKFESDPQVAKVAEVFSVDTLVSFVAKKLGV
ncbi:MAG: acyl carrier protein, partial [Pyrinomonadaceae bacterium]|nr:acyl carrier protein [Phycisphaerales bacterium]